MGYATYTLTRAAGPPFADAAIESKAPTAATGQGQGPKGGADAASSGGTAAVAVLSTFEEVLPQRDDIVVSMQGSLEARFDMNGAPGGNNSENFRGPAAFQDQRSENQEGRRL